MMFPIGEDVLHYAPGDCPHTESEVQPSAEKCDLCGACDEHADQLEGMSSSASLSSLEFVTTRHTKRFDGDCWGRVLQYHTVALCGAFSKEAAAACKIPQENITILELRLGSLYVTFHVTHDADVSEEEIQQRVDIYPFREVLRLYANRNAPPDGVDALLKRNAELEAEMKAALAKLKGENDERMDELMKEHEKTLRELRQQLEDKERELNETISQLQDAAERRRVLEEEKNKAIEAIRRERARNEKIAHRNSELVAAIIQENKKEMEAKEREFEEQLLEKDVVIENLRTRLRTKNDLSNGEAAHPGTSPLHAVDTDRGEEFAKLMGRMEEMAIVLEKTQESETEARGEIQKLSEALRLSEEARQSDAVIYENNMLALKQQLQAFRDTKLAEDHQKRQEESRARRSGNVVREERMNETIVRQYESALENLIRTLQDRLTILREEHASFITVSEKETLNERDILTEQDEENQRVRQAFRTASLTLQRVFWGTRDDGVPPLISELDNAAASSEKSRASVKVTLALLDSRMRSFAEQKEWMECHQQALEELMTSLRALNKRAFERQLTLMNEQSSKLSPVS
uniref:Flagellar attachment zone protein 1 conserved domain-containing protein n=1 Tax=Trypanosoma congolense (strain IL3000) TaxID=1068625 RepID=G0UL38_TRYCI|nr:conserved hypothetical protein [Trypanosoma congolense IL3000]